MFWIALFVCTVVLPLVFVGPAIRKAQREQGTVAAVGVWLGAAAAGTIFLFFATWALGDILPFFAERSSGG